MKMLTTKGRIELQLLVIVAIWTPIR